VAAEGSDFVSDALNKFSRLKAVKQGVVLQPPAPAAVPGGLAARLSVLQSVPEEDRRGDLDTMTEVRRIAALPVVPPLSPEELEAFCREHSLQSAYEGRGLPEPFRWNRLQAEAVLSWIAYKGLLGPLPVGSGKTLVLQYIAHLAFTEGMRKIVLLLPRGLIPQFVEMLAWARSRVPIAYPPPHSFLDLDPTARKHLANSNKRGLYLLPFSILSRESSADLLFTINPDLIEVDESFYLKNLDTSATTKRVFRYLDAREKANAPCYFVAVAGNITTKGPKDYAHLARAGLRERCPLPRDSAMLEGWSMAVETGAVPTSAGPLRPLVNWAKKHFPGEDFPEDVSGFRKAFTLRLTTAPGVVTASGADDLPISLTYCNVPVEAPETSANWGQLDTLIQQIRKLGITPNGDEIDCELHTFKWEYELAAGFYNELIWPTVDMLAKRRRCTQEEAADFLRLGQEHHLALNCYHGMLRKWLRAHPDKVGTYGPIDTPLLVAKEMSLSGSKFVGPELFMAWRDAKDREIPGMAERYSRAVRVCPYKVDAAVTWAKSLPKGEGAVLWVWHVELGEWAFEALRAAGVDAVHCPGGDQGSHDFRDPTTPEKVRVASIGSHYRGFNVQFLRHMAFLQWPRSALHAEQCVGRVHRQGQKADAIDVHMFHTTDFDWSVFSACAIDALYQHQTGGGRQKLIYGSYDPMPKVFTPEVLRQRNMEVQRLDPSLRAAFVERFGRAK
jgi:hypothetical protein